MDKYPVSRIVQKRFNKQASRGTQGFGFIAVKNGYVNEIFREERRKDIEDSLENTESDEILFHHRFPTSTENFQELTHPIVVKNQILKHNYFVVHNGVLHNEDDLKKDHNALGFEYTTEVLEVTESFSGGVSKKKETRVKAFNDSEAFAVDLALYLEGINKTIETIGSIAFICFQTDKNNKILKIFFGRNGGNPLIVEDNRDIFVIKSEGKGTETDADTLYEIDYATFEMTEKEVDIGRVSKHFGFRGSTNHWQRESDKVEKAEVRYLPENHPLEDKRNQLNLLPAFKESKEREEQLEEQLVTIESDIIDARNILYANRNASDLTPNDRIEYQQLLEDLLTDKRKVESDLQMCSYVE